VLAVVEKYEIRIETSFCVDLVLDPDPVVGSAVGSTYWIRVVESS
jgi:hypothetical protein